MTTPAQPTGFAATLTSETAAALADYLVIQGFRSSHFGIYDGSPGELDAETVVNEWRDLVDGAEASEILDMIR